jgi:hypothetical protein
MKPEPEGHRNNAADEDCRTRNPFGVMDVPSSNDQEVVDFAADVKLEGLADDENAGTWGTLANDHQPSAIEGNWSSRWNGGADATIPGDTKDKWKQGHAEARVARERVYFLFDWDNGARRGLIDAQRDGAKRLVGKYINLSNPDITRPWVGLIVSDRRIDGRWLGGRLDFRR